jgi:hypothetical protein
MKHLCSYPSCNCEGGKNECPRNLEIDRIETGNIQKCVKTLAWILGVAIVVFYCFS